LRCDVDAVPVPKFRSIASNTRVHKYVGARAQSTNTYSTQIEESMLSAETSKLFIGIPKHSIFLAPG
jgi:hypothetical protein